MIHSDDQTIQQKIVALLSKHPGLPLSKISELLDVNIQLLKDHLLTLEKNQTIIADEKTRGYKRYYLIESAKGLQEKRSTLLRRKIYTIISEEPGIHLSKIADLLDMRISHVEYHLSQMEKQHMVTSLRRTGKKYRRYYIENGLISTEDKRIIGLFRIQTTLKIVQLLLKNQRMRHRDLLRQLNVSSSTLSYHINKLVDHGIIQENSFGDEKGYVLLDEKRIIQLLKAYDMDVLVDGFNTLWDLLNPRSGTN